MTASKTPFGVVWHGSKSSKGTSRNGQTRAGAMRVFLLFSFSGFVGCGPPEPFPQVKGDVDVDRASLAPGADATVSVRIFNEGARPVWISLGCPYFYVRTVEVDPVNIETVGPGIACPAAVVPQLVEPGSVASAVIQWAGSGFSGARLTPGPYLIGASIPVSNLDQLTLSLELGPVSFAIVP